jgi:prolyl-tRNA synthetase
LDIYERAYEEILACSVIKGRKTDYEKFAGGDFTTTLEGYIPGSGRGIQAATSHSLGQNFSKMFDIQFQDEQGDNQHVWQNSWGFTTRSLGVMIMTHSDDKGLVLPPAIAPIQVVFVPIVKNNNSDTVHAAVEELAQKLARKNIRVEVDSRTNITPGFKYNHWELKGVPLRIEVGPRDLENQSVTSSRRDTGAKTAIKIDDDFESSVEKMLETIQNDLRAKAKRDHLNAITTARTWTDFMTSLSKDQLAMVPWCGSNECEEGIKVQSGLDSQKFGDKRSGAAKSLCIPFEQPSDDASCESCLKCQGPAQSWVLFGRSY